MDMQDEILSKLNESSCEEYEPFEFKFENIPKPGDHSDGLCVFYNTKSVKKIHVKKDTYSGLDGQHKTNRVYMMILFELIDSQKKLFVGTVHLKAKPPFFEARYLEVQEYFLRLEEFIKELQENEYIADEKEFDEIPCILTGDFNDETDSKAVLAVQNPEIAHKMQFKSAYCIDGVYPEFSTYKYRAEHPTKHVIDYIFYTENKRPDSINLQTIREIPAESEIIPGIGLPCHRYPSDHFSLAATFELN